ncbi:DUF6476 family protein [Pseudohalocynthiibacter aestuariivivens]|jgi:Family of unknown function (DUF6476)|uniref:DUF6476 family protein n=1 Tax=Pseudohalocynthiibacter aestuariivivens TaxID=1591409 RepID=A0ABV5JF76_9RHOB|nr:MULTISPECIES: DUF6476 family protein [Pseudohalocynthiibacter]MBS9717870.1 hypothetical protein [Pseudohalocynthiibacter aestuariivivens]MCK0102981.1 DUF6476 family protein [Pseudohalocynthiibacter sp. F2068]
MDDAPTPEELPANLKFLRLLVTVLTGTMIAGLVIIIALFVIRFSEKPVAQSAPLPEAITLPDGTTATAFTQGRDWYAVVTASDEILIFDRTSGTLRQTIRIEP